MDPLEEFLSPEALRLLLDSDDFATTVNEPSVTTSGQPLSIITPLAAGVNIPIPDESKPTRKRPASDDKILGCSTLVLDKGGSSKPKRAKFSAEGRAKVASVRKKGACMKCHRNKIPCSGEWPCESCCRSRAVIAGRASRHRWMDCVPFSFKELDIFAEENVPIDYSIDKPIKALLGTFNDYSWEVCYDKQESIVTRQRDADAPRWRYSLKDLVSAHIDKRLEESFQFLVAISLFLCFGEIKVEGSLNAYFVAGSRLLRDLERALSNNSLSGCDADKLRALVMIISFTASVITFPRLQSLRKSYDRQQQLLCVLAHHAAYIGERVDVWTGLAKEGGFAFRGPITIRLDQYPKVPRSSLGDPTECCDHSVGGMVRGILTASGPWSRDTSQIRLCSEIGPVSGQENGWAFAQRYLTAETPNLPNMQPEDGYWTSDGGNEIGSANSVATAAPLPELQTDTVCGWCGSVQTSYKPVQGVVLCDSCLPQYQQNDLTAAGLGLGQPQSTDQSFNPTSELDSFQGDETNYASWPDATASSSYGNDIDDFSWFMAS